MYGCAVYADNHVYIVGKQTYKISLQNNTIEVIAQMFNFLSEGPISCGIFTNSNGKKVIAAIAKFNKIHRTTEFMVIGEDNWEHGEYLNFFKGFFFDSHMFSSLSFNLKVFNEHF